MRLRTLNKLTQSGETCFPVRGDQLTSHREYIEHPRTWNHDPAYTEEQRARHWVRARAALIAWHDHPSPALLTAFTNATEYFTVYELNELHAQARNEMHIVEKSAHRKLGMFHDPEGNEYE